MLYLRIKLRKQVNRNERAKARGAAAAFIGCDVIKETSVTIIPKLTINVTMKSIKLLVAITSSSCHIFTVIITYFHRNNNNKTTNAKSHSHIGPLTFSPANSVALSTALSLFPSLSISDGSVTNPMPSWINEVFIRAKRKDIAMNTITRVPTPLFDAKNDIKKSGGRNPPKI